MYVPSNAMSLSEPRASSSVDSNSLVPVVVSSFAVPTSPATQTFFPSNATESALSAGKVVRV